MIERTILLALLLAAPAWAETEVSLPVSRIHPTQMAVGRADAMDLLRRLKLEASGNRDFPASYLDHMERLLGRRPEAEIATNPKGDKFARLGSPVDAGIYIQAALNAEPFPGVVLPDGSVAITDGHHRATMVAAADLDPALGGKAPGGRFEAKIQITRDYQKEGLSWEKTAQDLHKQNKVFYEAGVRARVESGDLAHADAFQASIPRTLAGLADSPMRSMMGNVLQELNIKSANFGNFIEFHVGERLAAKGVKIPADASIVDEKLKAELKKKILGDPEILTLLREKYRDGANANGIPLKNLGRGQVNAALTDHLLKNVLDTEEKAVFERLRTRMGAACGGP